MNGKIGSNERISDLSSSSSLSSFKFDESYSHQNCIDFLNYCQYFQQLCSDKESLKTSKNILELKTNSRNRKTSIERKPRQAYNTKQLERLESEFQVRVKCFISLLMSLLKLIDR